MKLLIALAAYNRKSVTELALKNLMQYKGPTTKIMVYNDWSTQYDNDFLEPLCDEVVKLPAAPELEVKKNSKNINGRGIAHIRWHQFRAFIKQDEFDFIYMTDPDTLHDPLFEKRLIYLYERYKYKEKYLPICLYNTSWHSDKERTVFEDDEVIIRKTIPGISQLYSMEMCQEIVTALDNQKEDPDYGWDYRSINFLQGLGVVSKQSFVEHFGASDESMHSKKDDWDRDRAINPTSYLHQVRQATISLLKQNEYQEHNKLIQDFNMTRNSTEEILLEFFQKNDMALNCLHSEINRMMEKIKDRTQEVAETLILKENTKQWLYKSRNLNRFYILVHDIKLDVNKTVALDAKLTVHGWSFEIFFRERNHAVEELENLFEDISYTLNNNRIVIHTNISFKDEKVNEVLQNYLNMIYVGHGK